MLVVNPQDPLGEILDYSQMSEIVDFCVKNRLALIACESLQHCIYPAVKESSKDSFISFRQVVNDLKSPLELFSIQSLSNGPFFKYSINFISF